jgi:hypothetical protein
VAITEQASASQEQKLGSVKGVKLEDVERIYKREEEER